MLHFDIKSAKAIKVIKNLGPRIYLNLKIRKFLGKSFGTDPTIKCLDKSYYQPRGGIDNANNRINPKRIFLNLSLPSQKRNCLHGLAER